MLWFLFPGFFFTRFRLQDAVGHGLQPHPGDVPGQVVQGVAVDGGGLAECCGHSDEARTIGPWFWKTFILEIM